MRLSFVCLFVCIFLILFAILISPVLAEIALDIPVKEVVEENFFSKIVAIVGTIVIPLLILVIGILFRSGKITKGQKEKAEKVILVLGQSVDAYKKWNKIESRKLTGLIAGGAKEVNIDKELNIYLNDKGLNK